MTETIKLSTLDCHFADFIVRIDGHPCDGLWLAAALASYSAGRGHSCFRLSSTSNLSILPTTRGPKTFPPADITQWHESLKRCDTVGAPGAYTPLVLDSDGRLYLHRCRGYEQQVTTGILSRCTPLTLAESKLETALDRHFPTQDATIDLQRSAARMALTHRFSVISGGPGTGKTATVARILALLLEMAGETPLEIALAAPTGKAALRLHQSILQAAAKLTISDEIISRLPTEVKTIHRLLGVQSRKGGFRHNCDNRLSCDVLVVDEASMVDLQLMAALLEALRDDTSVILLGDRNQLASVEAGAVLADICDSTDQAAIPVTQLTKSYRFDSNSGIAALSQLINSGESAAAYDLLAVGQYPDVLWRQLPPGKTFEDAFIAAAQNGYAGFARVATPDDALTELHSFRVLSPLRSGPYGIENLNRLCNRALPFQKNRPTPLMITGNNYELGLFNGDTGVTIENDGIQTVWFENPEGGLRHFSPLRLPPCEPAFALTVHKSQGSEFDRVLLVLPNYLSESLSRELLYTAVTRARKTIEIWGTEEVVLRAIEQRTERNSGLRDKLTRGMS